MKNLLLILMMASLVMIAGCDNPDEVNMAKLDVLTLDGKEINLSKYKGQKVFLNFWATWCGPCRAELPSMEKARKELEDEGYAFVLVSDEKAETISKFKEMAPFTFDYYKLPKSVKLLGIFTIPQTYIINSKGKVVKAFTDAHDWSTNEKMDFLRSID